MKTSFFMIEIILSVFSIPLYIIKRGKLKKMEKLDFSLGGGPLKKSPLPLLVKNKILTDGGTGLRKLAIEIITWTLLT